MKNTTDIQLNHMPPSALITVKSCTNSTVRGDWESVDVDIDNPEVNFIPCVSEEKDMDTSVTED